MPLTPQKENALPGPIESALCQVPCQSDRNAEQANPSSRGEKLKDAFAAYGLHLHQLLADEMAVTGPGFPARLIPDRHAAHCLLRQLRGAMA